MEEEDRTYLFKWVPVEELHAYNLQPAFIKEKVKNIESSYRTYHFTRLNVFGGEKDEGLKRDINDKVFITHISKKVLVPFALCFQVQDTIMISRYFYYATMLMLEHKIDVVHIHYSYDEQVMNKPMEEVTKIMMDDINPVMKEVLKAEQYNDTIFLGKSLGTIPIANDLMKREEFYSRK